MFAVASFVVVLGAQELWLPLIGKALVTADPLRPADAIVPLAGDRSRVDEAAELFKHGYANRFVITNMWIDSVSPPLKYAELVREQAVRAHVPEQQILVATNSVSTTYTEAMSLRRFAQEQHWRSVLVITSPSHSRRARMILRAVFRDTNIAITVRPVNNHWYTPQTWWKSREGVKETGLEYLKLAAYFVGYG